jgi:hypothetical protein
MQQHMNLQIFVYVVTLILILVLIYFKFLSKSHNFGSNFCHFFPNFNIQIFANPSIGH